MRGRYLEEFTAGEVFTTTARTVTEADVVGFAGLSGDFNSIHTDEEFARSTPYGRRIAHNVLGIAFATGLTARLGLFDGTAIAFRSLDWRFLAPIFIGDTVRCEISILEVQDKGEDDRGAVVRGVRVLNQDGAVVQEGTSTMMVLRRPSRRPDA